MLLITGLECAVNAIARFESFIERLMERTFTRATHSQLQPVEIAKRLVRAMEADQSVGVRGIIVPNVYEVYLSPEDYQLFKPAQRSIARNLESHLARAARQRSFQLVSRPMVLLDVGEQLVPGDIRVVSHLRDVEAPEPSAPEHTSLLPPIEEPISNGRPTSPNLSVDGHTYAVLRSPTSLGRLASNDIVLNDRRVSRHHADLLEQDGRWLVRDAGSTNGTAVNGKIVREAVLKPGDRISLGGLELTWDQ